MERQNAEVIFSGVTWETKKLLAAAAAAVKLPSYRREFLEKARDRLSRACLHFEMGDACELHDDCYLPLFDALAFVTDALKVPALESERITQALFVLDAEPVKVVGWDIADAAPKGGV